VRTDASVYGDGFPLKMEIDEKADVFYRYLMLTEKGKPIAACRLQTDASGVGKIERVSVIREQQKKGYGRQLIQETEKWAEELGMSRLVITSRETVTQFYQKLGYTIREDIDLNQPDEKGNPPFVRCVYMEKRVEAKENGSMRG
jgi:N-acetylglutamate synthase-like GNAT family acetyltransferase